MVPASVPQLHDINAAGMSPNTVYRFPVRTSYRDLCQFTESIPAISESEVLVRVRSVSLNYRDLAIANSTYPFPVKDNVCPCSDASGQIIAVGSRVNNGLRVGDRVIGNFDVKHVFGPQQGMEWSHGGPIDGVLRQYVTFSENAVTRIPDSCSLGWEQLSSMVTTGVTAWNALYGNVQLKPGQTVLFQGTGGISIAGLILAKAAGATTIITSSSDAKLQRVYDRFGPDHVINYKATPNWAQEALRLTNGRGVDFIFENGGAGTIQQSVECLTYGGVICVIGFVASAKDEFVPDVAALALSKGAIIRGVMVGSKQQCEELVSFVCTRNLEMPIAKTYGFAYDEVMKAFDYLSGRGHIGKVCIRVD